MKIFAHSDLLNEFKGALVATADIVSEVWPGAGKPDSTCRRDIVATIEARQRPGLALAAMALVKAGDVPAAFELVRAELLKLQEVAPEFFWAPPNETQLLALYRRIGMNWSPNQFWWNARKNADSAEAWRIQIQYAALLKTESAASTEATP